ncbi:unnamed protein product [Dibothriocephalus latus]|uniref:Uncharacterized protein n=1 Tax=Dibothriocephalus latus TaxID=60516 RepID=A0A3P7PAS2_DIBLA|nr:unnamed protein product [Dibothriocephalus latus]
MSSPVATAPASAPVGVPHIDQMLRPMGQLEAFVNTISMSASLESSGADGLVIASESSAFCQSESSSSSTAAAAESDTPGEAVAVIPISSTEETLPVQPSSEEVVESKEDEDVVPDESLQAAGSLTAEEDNKELSEGGALSRDLEACASPAKRPRLMSPSTTVHGLPLTECQDSEPVIHTAVLYCLFKTSPFPVALSVHPSVVVFSKCVPSYSLFTGHIVRILVVLSPSWS